MKKFTLLGALFLGVVSQVAGTSLSELEASPSHYMETGVLNVAPFLLNNATGSIINFDGVIGSNDQTADPFSIYPNPASSGYVNITSRETGAKKISIFDVLGKEVINTTLFGDRLDISALNSGIYILKIEQGKISTTKKLVVE